MSYNSKYTGAQVEALLDKVSDITPCNPVVTLDGEPTGTTLTYTDDSGTHSFAVGDLVRVADATSAEGYAFWRLYDIKDGAAVWKKLEYGGGDFYETVIVTLTSGQTQPDTGLNGAVVHVKYADVDETQTWQGESLTFRVPTSMTYTVEYPKIDGYVKPENAAERLANSGNFRNLTGTYIAIKISCITINQDSKDPDSMISGDINSDVIQWIRNNSHRVLGKYTANGVVTYCQLDDLDGTKYHDGTSAILTGEEGDVFMKLPQFWYKLYDYGQWTSGSETMPTFGILFSLTKVDDTWNEWDGKELIGVYWGTWKDEKLYSISDATIGAASTGVTIPNLRTYASNRGTGMSLVKWKHHCMMAALFYAIYGNTNYVSRLGMDAISDQTIWTKKTGLSNHLCMTDSSPINDSFSNFWGLENWCSILSEVFDDVTYKVVGESSTRSVYLYINDGSSYTSYVNYLSNSSVITKPVTKLTFSRYSLTPAPLDLVPSFYDNGAPTSYALGYSSAIGAGYGLADSGFPVARGPYNGISAFVGLLSINSSLRKNSTIGAQTGSRLCFTGTLIEEPDVAAYKALTAIG